MSSLFKEQDYSGFLKSENNTTKFLSELRTLLDKHNVRLYTDNCQVYTKELGYIGCLEDNVDSIDIVQEEKVIYSSSSK